MAVVGGGDAAVEEAIFLTRYASKVYLLHRRGRFRAQPVLVEKAQENPKLEILLNTTVAQVHGEDQVEYLTIKREGELERLDVSGLFVFIGFTPNTEHVRGAGGAGRTGLHRHRHPHGDVRSRGSSSAGDVRSQLTRQITTAVGDGTTAAIAAQHYVESLEDAAVSASS